MKLLSTIDWLQSKPPRDTQTSVNSVGGWGSGVEFVVYVNPTPSSLLSALLCLWPLPSFFSSHFPKSSVASERKQTDL